MNYLWGGMILVGVIYAAFTGNMNAVTNQALASAKEAISLCITMAGAMAFWVGIMRIAEHQGILEKTAQKMNPILNFLFPSVPKSSPARSDIASNIVANVLGLGWAATPAGLKAMEQLSAIQDEKAGHHVDTASDDMCTFLVINISSIQLIPVNIIAYRMQYGSTAPAAIIIPGLIATIISTAVGIICCRLFSRKRVKKR